MTSHDIGPQKASTLFPPSSSDLSSTRAASDCPQCHKQFNLTDREPYVLGSTCFHSVCLSCLQKGTRADGTFECTLCHKPGPYVRNFALSKIIKERGRMREIPLLSARSDDVYSEDGDITNVESVPSTPKVAVCAECYDDEVAVNHCGECRRWLCALHSAAHRKGTLTFNHRLESMEEAKVEYTSVKATPAAAATASVERGGSVSSSARASAVTEEDDDKVMRCPKHRGVIQDMFCVTEQVLVCPKCAMTDHRAHEVKDSQEVFQEQRTAIEKGLRKVRSRLNRLNAIIAAIGEKAIQGGSHYMKTKAEIESVFTQLAILLKDRRAELEKSLDEVNAKRTMALATHKETLMAEKQRLEQLAEQTQLTLEGTDADDARVLAMSGMLLQALKAAADGAAMAGGDNEESQSADAGAATNTPGSAPSGSSSAVHRTARPGVVTVPSKDPKAAATKEKEKDPSKELLDINVAFVCKDRTTMENLISRLGQLLVHTPSRTKSAGTSGPSSGTLMALPVDGVDVILAKNSHAADTAEPSDAASSSGESKSAGDQLPLTARLAQSAALGLSSLLRQSPVRAAPILVAAAHGQLEVVQWLLDNQLAVQGETDSEGHTPLLLAAANGHLHLLSWLLKSRKARIQERDAKGNTALLLAARFGRLKVVQWLLTEGYSSIKEKNKEGQTALVLAATHSTGFVHEYAEDGTFIQDKPSNGGPTYRWITERYGYAIPEDEQQQAERIFEQKQEELQKKKKKSAQNPSRQSIQEAPESLDDDAAASYEGSEYSADTVSEYSSSNLNEPIFSARTVESVTSILDVSSARGPNAKTNDVLAPFNSLRTQAPPSRTPRRKLRDEVPDLPE